MTRPAGMSATASLISSNAYVVTSWSSGSSPPRYPSKRRGMNLRGSASPSMVPRRVRPLTIQAIEVERQAGPPRAHPGQHDRPRGRAPRTRPRSPAVARCCRTPGQAAEPPHRRRELACAQSRRRWPRAPAPRGRRRAVDGDDRSQPIAAAAMTADRPTVPQPNTAIASSDSARRTLTTAPAPVCTPQPSGASDPEGDVVADLTRFGAPRGRVTRTPTARKNTRSPERRRGPWSTSRRDDGRTG